MNKTLRNKALSGATKLMYTDYHGQKWFTDTYVALNTDITEGYKPRKYHIDYRDRTDRPVLDGIVDKQNLKLAEFTELMADGELTLVKHSTIDGQAMRINKVYHDLLMNIYPNAVAWIDTEAKYAPVHYKVGFDTVAVVMPIRY